MTTVSSLHDGSGATRPRWQKVPHVETLTSSAYPAWDDYVEHHEDANLYHLRAWKEVAENAYHLEAPFLVSRDRAGGPVRGVLPLFRIPRPFASYLTNGLFGAYGRLLADDDDHARALLAAASEQVAARRVDFIHLKLLGEIPPRTPLVRRDHWITAVLDLAATVDTHWKGLSRNMRWAVRHAERAGLVTVRGRKELDAFYDVLSENMLRKGTPIYGHRFFEALTRSFGARADVLTLREGDRTVSGAYLVSYRGVMYVPFASSRPAAFSLRANNLLFWEIAKLAIETGHHTLDLGSSLRDSSGFEFKRGWHPRVEPIGSYVQSRIGTTAPLLPTESAVARGTVRVWSRLPASVAETLGPFACRWIA